jgi:hypothetical protein
LTPAGRALPLTRGSWPPPLLPSHPTLAARRRDSAHLPKQLPPLLTRFGMAWPTRPAPTTGEPLPTRCPPAVVLRPLTFGCGQHDGTEMVMQRYVRVPGNVKSMYTLSSFNRLLTVAASLKRVHSAHAPLRAPLRLDAAWPAFGGPQERDNRAQLERQFREFVDQREERNQLQWCGPAPARCVALATPQR